VRDWLPKMRPYKTPRPRRRFPSQTLAQNAARPPEKLAGAPLLPPPFFSVPRRGEPSPLPVSPPTSPSRPCASPDYFPRLHSQPNGVSRARTNRRNRRASICSSTTFREEVDLAVPAILLVLDRRVGSRPPRVRKTTVATNPSVTERRCRRPSRLRRDPAAQVRSTPLYRSIQILRPRLDRPPKRYRRIGSSHVDAQSVPRQIQSALT
jgi:hypothetical protein